MDFWKILLLLMLCRNVIGTSGSFWHISDLHLDPEYQKSTDPLKVCPSAGTQPVINAGTWGDYLCDSPWILINSSIYAMKKILPDPDFILWTGDDTPHVPDEKLGEKIVLEIIEKLTNLIRDVFPGLTASSVVPGCPSPKFRAWWHKGFYCENSQPSQRYQIVEDNNRMFDFEDTQVYPAMGNHDFHPKNQFPAVENKIYNVTAGLWQPWLDEASIQTFKTGAFYSQLLPGVGPRRRIIVLNTNLYYDRNNQSMSLEDPGGQFRWLETLLAKASKTGEKVYIVGHVPPGIFEKKRSKPWFRKHFNQRYTEIIQKHHAVIAAQFFGHHHTDSFRMFYDTKDFPISVIFLAPAITPWKTSLPGVQNGANNPGIRVFQYDRNTLLVKDIVTYYLNLTHANMGTPEWKKEYSLAEAYEIPDGSVHSMHLVLEKLMRDEGQLQKYYRYNSVQYDSTFCNDNCRTDHICAIREVDFEKYNQCVIARSAAAATPILNIFLLCSTMGLLTLGLLDILSKI